jgi:hypothetical protein
MMCRNFLPWFTKLSFFVTEMGPPWLSARLAVEAELLRQTSRRTGLADRQFHRQLAVELAVPCVTQDQTMP